MRERAPAPNLSRERLHAGLSALGLTLPADAAAQLLAYVEELVKWNAAYNLTAVREPAEMVTRHVLDSLSLLPVLDGLVAGSPSVVSLLDVGAGAGLPCIPLAIARPAWRVTGLDSNGKKARFMRHAGRTLAIANFSVIEGRAEDVVAGEAPFTLITSRAFASLADFFAATQHRLAEQGHWVAMKGKLGSEELAAVPPQIRICQPLRLNVPGLAEERHAIVAEPTSK